MLKLSIILYHKEANLSIGFRKVFCFFLSAIVLMKNKGKFFHPCLCIP